MSMLNEIISTVGYGLIIFALLLCAMTGCCHKDKKDRSVFGVFGWLCMLAGFILQIIAIWIHSA